MGLKKRNKTSAEFSMSSLTDIIFLLLIFFMLTANFVRIQPFELPKSDNKTVAPTSIAVSISKDGTYKLNNLETSFGKLKSAIRRERLKVKKDEDNSTVSIAAEVGTPFNRVLQVMDIAKDLKMRAIILTSPLEE